MTETLDPYVAASAEQPTSDQALRRRLGAGALELASRFTWKATARGTLEALASAAAARHRR